MSRRTSQSRYHVPLETWKEDEVFSNSADDLRDLAEMLKKDSETNDTSNGNGLSQARSVTNRSSRSSLIRAVRRGSSSTVAFLQEATPDQIILSETDNHQRNAFHYAITKLDSLKTLLQRFKTDPSLEAVLRQEDEFEKTPIHRAASMGNSKSLEILDQFDNTLIKLRTKITKRSVLHFAVESASLLAVEIVLRKDPEQIDISDNMLMAPIHYAARLKHADILSLLTSKGADTSKKDANGQLPIHIAAKEGLFNNVQLLIDVDPDCIDCKENQEQTPLILAAKNGFPHVVSHLLSKGVSYGAKDTYGCTAFDWAVKREAAGVIEVFLGKDYWKEV